MAVQSFIDLKPPVVAVLDDVRKGLSGSPKTLPSKYLYDARGCELFDAICELPEYYPTRTELGLMECYQAEIGAFVGSDCALVEFGSGSGLKTRLLLEAARPAVYLPVDIARGVLQQLSAQLAECYPWLNIMALCADYTRPFTLPEEIQKFSKRNAVYFPGSTIGNFTREQAFSFLLLIRELLGQDGVAIIGVDLKKDPQLLHDAYNDAQGVTAAFSLNVLTHLNRVVGTDFDKEAFAHVAFYHEGRGRIETHLEACSDTSVQLGNQVFQFDEGERVLTEISCKYSIEEFQELARRAGFHPQHVWVDPDNLFSVHGLSV